MKTARPCKTQGARFYARSKNGGAGARVILSYTYLTSNKNYVTPAILCPR